MSILSTEIMKAKMAIIIGAVNKVHNVTTQVTKQVARLVTKLFWAWLKFFFKEVAPAVRTG